jgi:hypothetical protein
MNPPGDSPVPGITALSAVPRNLRATKGTVGQGAKL